MTDVRADLRPTRLAWLAAESGIYRADEAARRWRVCSRPPADSSRPPVPEARVEPRRAGRSPGGHPRSGPGGPDGFSIAADHPAMAATIASTSSRRCLPSNGQHIQTGICATTHTNRARPDNIREGRVRPDKSWNMRRLPRVRREAIPRLSGGGELPASRQDGCGRLNAVGAAGWTTRTRNESPGRSARLRW